MELLIVIVVLGILSGIVLFGVSRFRADAQQAACTADLATVGSAAVAFDAATGSYPADVDALVTGGYLKTVPDGTYQFDATAKTVTRTPACTTTAAAPTSPSVPAPVHQYDFDEASGPTAADSAGDADGTYGTGITYSGPPAPGATGTSIACDGSTSAVTYPLGGFSSGRSPFTVALWARPTTVDDKYRMLFREGLHDGGFAQRVGFSILSHGADGVLFERFDLTSDRDIISNTGQGLTVNQWNQVVVTYDGSEMKLYLNRTLAGSTPATRTVPSTAAYPAQSCDWGQTYPEGTFAGQLDGLRIWNQALTAEQITTLP